MGYKSLFKQVWGHQYGIKPIYRYIAWFFIGIMMAWLSMMVISQIVRTLSAYADVGNFEPLVQHYSQSMSSSSSVDVNLGTVVDPDRSFLRIETSSSSDTTATSTKVTGEFINDGATVRLRRQGTATGVTVILQVISHPDIEVEHGTISAGSGVATVDQSVTDVGDMNNTAIFINNRGTGTASNYLRQQWAVRLTSATNINIQRGVTGDSSTVNYQVVRFLHPDVQVQHATVSIGSASSATSVIRTVNTAKSFIIGTWRTDSANLDRVPKWEFGSSTQVIASKGTSTGTTTVEIMVVSMPEDATSQHNSISNISSPSNISVSNVAQDKTFTILSASSTSTGTNWDRTTVSSSLTSTTNVAANRGDTSGTTIGRLQTIELWALPHPPIFHNLDGTNQVAFNNILHTSITPNFRLSTDYYQSLDRLQIEMNTELDFSGTAYTQTFSGAYSSGAEYNFMATGLSPSLPTTDGVTYFVRARASHNAGTDYGSWSSKLWAYTYRVGGGLAGWRQSPLPAEVGGPQAAGGDISFADGWYYHTFTSSGSFMPLEGSIEVEYLVVGGGGAGGQGANSGTGGGGGAGGALENEGGTLLEISSGQTITVGDGGEGSSLEGENGNPSSIGSLVVADGGGGGGGDTLKAWPGGDGGSGGGAGGSASGGSGTLGQGNNGGSGSSGNSGGGGGGAGATGGNGSGSPGDGGDGIEWPAGSGNWYAGGGGGASNSGTNSYVSDGGLGGGGRGASGSQTGQSAVSGTGGGGGATRLAIPAGSGGSGIVIIRYQGIEFQHNQTPAAFSWSGNYYVPDGVTEVNVLIVGGGGGGATSNSAGGGGGAGQVRWEEDVAVTPGSSISVVIGAGGAGSIGSAQGDDGESSSFGVLSAAGGGGGGGGSSSTNGRPGASGGGGVRTGVGGTGTSGSNGGDGFESGTTSLRSGGGGGGAGSIGDDGISGRGGNGGAGVDMSSYVGTGVGDSGWFGGGGGGGRAGTGGTLASGGPGGGGDGGRSGTSSISGAPLTGGGGGGGGGDNAPAGSGGSGIVIVVWEDPIGGGTLSSEIDFSWVPGADSWGTASFETIDGQEATMSVYYSDETSCDTIVPDSVLPGNSDGFMQVEGPISLAGLDTGIYQKICLLGIPGESADDHYIENWTVTWRSGQMRHGTTFEEGSEQPIAL